MRSEFLLAWLRSSIKAWQCNETINRDDRIRTCGPFVPNEVRYQTAPHPGPSILKDRCLRD